VEQSGSSSGSYPEGRWFKSSPRYHSYIIFCGAFALFLYKKNDKRRN
jgi:hypothetical protein